MKHLKTKLDPLMKMFLEQLVLDVTGRYPRQIVSVILFGSATTQEWVKGKSDIDMIVVVKDRTKRKEIERYFNRVLLKLDEDYGFELSNTCSTYRKRENSFVNTILKIESFMTFGRPFYVLSLDQIDFEKGKVRDWRVLFIASVFDSFDIFLSKIKQTGIVLYGDNLIEKLTFTASKSSKIRTAMAPLWLLLIAFLTALPDKTFSLEHSMKATIWACEDALFAMGVNPSSMKNNLNMLKKILSNCEGLSFQHVEKTLEYRRNWSFVGNMISQKHAFRFLFSSICFVLTLYSLTVFKCILR